METTYVPAFTLGSLTPVAGPARPPAPPTTPNFINDVAAGKVEQVADTLAQTADNDELSEGTRQVAATTVNILDRTSEYLRNGDVGIVVDDFRSIVRRHPLRSLVVGLGLGYLARSTFFPAAPKPPSVPTGGRQPYNPTYQQVPVFGGSDMDAMGAASSFQHGTSLGDATGFDTIPTTPVDNFAVDAVSLDDDFTDIGTTGSGLGMSSSLDNDLTDINTVGGGLGMSSSLDSPSMLNDLSAGDLVAYADEPASMRSDTSDMNDFAVTSGDLSSDVTSIGGDNELLAGDETLGAASLDTPSATAYSVVDEQANADDALDAPTDTILPSDDLLREWDDTTSGSNQDRS